MFSRMYILLILTLFTLTANAQDINKWINTELAKGKNKTLLNDYTAARFFSTDSSRIIGYIKGYDTTLKFTSGIIYMENVITREDYPTVVRIHPDGRFETDLKMMHPQCIVMMFNRKYFISVYIEPGQVNSLVFDWKLLEKTGNFNKKFNESIVFGGPTARINTELSSIEQQMPDYEAFLKQVKTLTPDAFKVAQQKKWEDDIKKLDAQLAGKKYLEHSKTILRNQIDVENATWFLDYIMNRGYESKDTANKIVATKESADFYDFLYKTNFNRQELLMLNRFSTFINRVEYSKPYRESVNKAYTPDSTTAKLSPQVVSLLGQWKMSDTLLKNKYGITPGFLSELARARSLKYVFENMLQDKKDDARTYLTQLANGMSHPFLMKESEGLFRRSFSDAGKAYTLPDNKSAAIFKGIINRHKGKMLFVDFWATSCGPCVGNIKA